jgi:hypothetical protein
VSRITPASFHGRAPASIIPLTVADATEDFEVRIRQLWSRGSGHTLELAMAVRTARRQLRHGQWAALFHSGRMPFSKRQADRLVGIARLDWLNGTSLSHLPRSWTSLHCLSRLARPVLERLIEQGTVHPGLTLREVRELVSASTENPVPFNPRDVAYGNAWKGSASSCWATARTGRPGSGNGRGMNFSCSPTNWKPITAYTLPNRKPKEPSHEKQTNLPMDRRVTDRGPAGFGAGTGQDRRDTL